MAHAQILTRRTHVLQARSAKWATTDGVAHFPANEHDL